LVCSELFEESETPPERRLIDIQAIKEAADTAGMQTTVTLRQPGNTARASPGEIANLMLKYSMKTLGINWTLALPDFNHLLKKRSMLFGLDVVHAPPGARKGAPSVGGLVYSVNPSPGQFLPYVFIMTPQVGKASQEVVPQAYLRPGIEYALRGWQKRQGQLPEILFMCRDGVSDTQLEQVLNEELPAMKNAARNVYGNQQIPELFILNTQKRHVTRFFKSKDDKAADKLRAFDDKGNPMPGLIVDTNIVSRTRDDWYSVSHKCLQGTVRQLPPLTCVR
jgi:eukaryotic translation initiation factor 2C